MNVLDSRKLHLQYEAIEALGKLDLPENLDLDILKGQLLYLAGEVTASQTRDSDYEPREIYNYLILYGMASAVIRNSGGKYLKYFSLLNDVFSVLEPSWPDIKEKVKNIPANIHDAAEVIIEESRTKLTYYYVTSAIMPIGFAASIAMHVNIPMDEIVYIITVVGAVCGCAIFLFNEIFNRSAYLFNAIRVIDYSESKY